jgi:hypothetical protein
LTTITIKLINQCYIIHQGCIPSWCIKSSCSSISSSSIRSGSCIRCVCCICPRSGISGGVRSYSRISSIGSWILSLRYRWSWCITACISWWNPFQRLQIIINLNITITIVASRASKNQVWISNIETCMVCTPKYSSVIPSNILY